MTEIKRDRLCFHLLLTLLLPLALLVMLESLLATISTSFADITTHVELSSPERQLLTKPKGNKQVRQGSQEESRSQTSAGCHFHSNTGEPVRPETTGTTGGSEPPPRSEV